NRTDPVLHTPDNLTCYLQHANVRQKSVKPVGVEGALMVLIHKECGGPALDKSPVGEVWFPFSYFTCLEEIVDESQVRLSEELGI
ncbi:MAG: hypothetical protein AABY61_08130, partial [Nitrospirota bacterium]